MKALVYRGPRDIRVEDVPDPKIEWPTDVLVRITSTNICGSDLHMYEGRTDLEPGQVVGHENLGEVIEVGPAVRRIKRGDRVCLPFNVSCGYCRNCERGFTGFCLSMNPPNAGAAYGYADMGPYPGGQAEYLKVPYGDFNCLRELIHADKAAPSFIVSHELPLDQGPDAYQHFDAREHGWTKVILHPGLKAARKPRAREAMPQPRRRPSRPTATVGS